MFLSFFFLTVTMTAQRNTGYISLSLPDRGIGLMYERNFNHASAYVSLTKGKYQINNDSPLNSIRFACGAIKQLNQRSYKFLYGAGLNYSHVWGNSDLPKLVYFPISFDIAFGGKINKTAVLVLIDPIKKVSQLNFGYTF